MLKRFLRKIYYNIIIRIYAISRIFKMNLGSYVLYKNKKYKIHNGVRSNYWRLEPSVDLPSDRWVKRCECKKIMTLNNLKQTYSFFVSFYTTNWLSIWIENGKKRGWL